MIQLFRKRYCFYIVTCCFVERCIERKNMTKYVHIKKGINVAIN